MASSRIQFDEAAIAAFCQKWKVVELSLFGSVLRDDFRPDSDVDVLIAFEEGLHYGIDEYIEMVAELESIYGHPIDLVNRRYLENPFMRHRILTTRQVVYAA